MDPKGAPVLALLLFSGCPPSVQIVQVQIAPPPPAPAPAVTAEPRAAPAEVDRPTEAAARKALWSFVNAYRGKRYDELVRFIPDAEQGHEPLTPDRLQSAWEGPMQEKVSSAMSRIAEALQRKEPILVSGRGATMPYGAGEVVELVFEDGRWKVRDF